MRKPDVRELLCLQSPKALPETRGFNGEEENFTAEKVSCDPTLTEGKVPNQLRRGADSYSGFRHQGENPNVTAFEVCPLLASVFFNEESHSQVARNAQTYLL